MRFHNFWCISFLSSELLYHVQKTPKSWEKICSITIFHQDPEKTLLQAWKPLKIAFFLPTSFSDNHGQKSWDTFAFLGRFPIHTGPTPPLTPQTMLNACIQNFFRVSTLYRVVGGRTAREFRKGCTVLRGNREMTEKYKYCSTVPRTFVQDCRLNMILRVNVVLKRTVVDSDWRFDDLCVLHTSNTYIFYCVLR